jgi:HEAT repeat protein
MRLVPLIWIAAGLLLFALGVAGCGPDEAQEASSPPPAEIPRAKQPTAVEPPASAPADRAEDDELAAAVRALESADPEQRSDAVFDIEPEGQGLRSLLQVLRDDPDPGVRGLAARQLAYAESPEATSGLVSALEDPAPEVVIEAIGALELIDDSSVIGSLEKLAQHRDPGVREAAAEAIDYLR